MNRGVLSWLVQVQVKKAVRNKEVVVANENGSDVKGMRAPTIRRSKLLIVDLAGSERVDKSGIFMGVLSVLATKHFYCSMPWNHTRTFGDGLVPRMRFSFSRAEAYGHLTWVLVWLEHRQ